MLSFPVSFSPPPNPELPLPSGIARTYISTPSGHLELLSAIPSTASSSKSPIIFCHGGFGSALVWTEWMTYLFQKHQIPCYAVSLRGHGASWYPNYFRMVFCTGIGALAGDLVSAVEYIAKEREGKEVVLVGHSSGGGIVQHVLSEGMLEGKGVRVKGMALCAGSPCFGQLCVYINWWTLDPVFSLRMILHLWHPKSPLSSTALVKSVFFSPQMSTSQVQQFEPKMSNYESYIWPIVMMRRSFINVKNVLCSLTSQRNGVLVLAGSVDKLMGVEPMKKMVECYQQGFRELLAEKKIEEPAKEESGVEFDIIEDSGHHFQNDLRWEIGAERLAHWYKQL